MTKILFLADMMELKPGTGTVRPLVREKNVSRAQFPAKVAIPLPAIIDPPGEAAPRFRGRTAAFDHEAVRVEPVFRGGA
jgi:hypothetical protein